MTITDTTKQAAFLQETGECYLILLTIAHADLAASIRVVNNNEDIVSNGNTFSAFPFNCQLPDATEDTPPRARLIIDNTSQEIAQAIRTISSKATVLIQVIRAADPDTIERSFSEFDMRNVKWDASRVSGDLEIEGMESEPFPAGEFNPAEFSGLFSNG